MSFWYLHAVHSTAISEHVVWILCCIENDGPTRWHKHHEKSFCKCICNTLFFNLVTQINLIDLIIGSLRFLSIYLVFRAFILNLNNLLSHKKKYKEFRSCAFSCCLCTILLFVAQIEIEFFEFKFDLNVFDSFRKWQNLSLFPP